MLHDIELLLKERGSMTLNMLARQLKSSESAVAGMLTLLVDRGRVVKTQQSACHGHCCTTGDTQELYAWQGRNDLPVIRLE